MRGLGAIWAGLTRGLIQHMTITGLLSEVKRETLAPGPIQLQVIYGRVTQMAVLLSGTGD
ncbi:hypothetical protein SDC9_189692 [bioreactor metagenome]|uniref:Uncharacterized protein n=1 Tax=bioreactor metagenome TaxID=1076179 RepID=A0A645HU82_9ZZZZ